MTENMSKIPPLVTRKTGKVVSSESRNDNAGAEEVIVRENSTGKVTSIKKQLLEVDIPLVSDSLIIGEEESLPIVLSNNNTPPVQPKKSTINKNTGSVKRKRNDATKGEGNTKRPKTGKLFFLFLKKRK